jgi:ribosomal protein S18 acetylase RimI-like enzyme
MSCLIRPMQPADLAAIYAVQCAAYANAYHEPQAALASHLAAGPGSCFVATRDAELLAYVFAHPWVGEPPQLHQALPAADAADQLFLHDLAVHPAARHQGIADALWQAVLARAQATGLGEIRLVAVQGAATFWQRAGFVRLAQAAPDCYGDALLMRRAL